MRHPLRWWKGIFACDGKLHLPRACQDQCCGSAPLPYPTPHTRVTSLSKHRPWHGACGTCSRPAPSQFLRRINLSDHQQDQPAVLTASTPNQQHSQRHSDAPNPATKWDGRRATSCLCLQRPIDGQTAAAKGLLELATSATSPEFGVTELAHGMTALPKGVQ